MKVLLIHQNFPGQWIHIAEYYKKNGNEVFAIRDSASDRKIIIPTASYTFKTPEFPNPHPVPFALHYELRLARAEAVATAAFEIKKKGFVPDLIASHGGWGENLLIKEVFPEAKQILYAEFFYRNEGADSNFDPEFRFPNARARLSTLAKNSVMCTALGYADRGLAPTLWQQSGFPKHLRDHIEVIHDGVNTETVRPDPNASVVIHDGEHGENKQITLKPGDPVVTFVVRNMEPYRGYHIFMRALPKILKSLPKARVIIVGGNSVSYGRAAPPGQTWHKIFLDEVKDKIDLSRVHFVGRIPYEQYLRVIQISAAHVYLTYPFVLSWSMLEAMSAGCVVIGSKTPPVEEVIEHEKNGLLVDFFDHEKIADSVIRVLKKPSQYSHLRLSARETIQKRYDLNTICLPKMVDFFAKVARGDYS